MEFIIISGMSGAGKSSAAAFLEDLGFYCVDNMPVALITSCSETFVGLFPKGPSYRVWAIVFCLMSFVFANLGLSTIISYAVPVLMFLYPLAITLIALSLFGKFFAYDRAVFVWTTALTLVGALYDFAAALPAPLLAACRLDGVLAMLRETLPLAKLGLFWLFFPRCWDSLSV